jgi:uncharacterized membrane protein YjgN (DUF898 family)
MATEYRIYYLGGLREGFSRDQVRDNLINTIGLAPEKVDQIFSSGRLLLVKSGNRELVEKHLDSLHQAGLQVEMQSSDPHPAADPAGPARPASPPPPPPPGSHYYQSSHGTGGQGKSGAPGRHLFEFVGSGGEYFRIWIANLLLTIITLGFYSPWAKVRRKNYFYGNTVLARQSFEYTASPTAILKGRIIAFVCLVFYNLSSQISPFLQIALSGVLLIMFPWIINRSLKFNAANSMYRGIRFGFAGGYWRACFIYIIMPALAFIPLVAMGIYIGLTYGSDEQAIREEFLKGNYTGLIIVGGAYVIFGVLWAVYVYYRQQRYIVDNFRFGTSGFRFETGPLPYYMAALTSGLLFVLTIAVAVGLSFLFYSGGSQTMYSLMNSPLPMILVIALTYLTTFAYFSAKSMHIRYNNTRVDQQEFSSRITGLSYIWLVASNTFLTAITLGLFTPWAKVRAHRYLMNRIQLNSPHGLDQFTADEEQKVGAAGEEFSDLWDFDIGF